MPLQNILVATDFSPHASHALDVALECAEHFDGRLWIVHVLVPPLLYGAELSTASLRDRVIDAQREVAHTGLAQALTRCATAGISARAQAVVGEPAAEIVELSPQADLIVMGTRGRTGFERLALGSVAERVVQTAKCPVLVVPAAHASSFGREVEHARTTGDELG